MEGLVAVSFYLLPTIHMNQLISLFAQPKQNLEIYVYVYLM